MNLWRRIIPPISIGFRLRQDMTIKSLHNRLHRNVNITPKIENSYQSNILFNIVRWKSKKHQYDSDDDDNNVFDDDSSLSKDSKVIKFSTTSMRADIILKSALGISRNKIEQMFYESKLRINGKKVLKKSANIKLGDEVDIIKMVSPNNPDHLYVARVEVLNIVPKEESINVTARRFKNLLIENYENDPHSASAESNVE